jgi:5-methylcytosine-specific restriction protein A
MASMRTVRSVTDPAAVRLALTEFDREGRDVFLAKHGFGPARDYLLRFDGKLYDSKAVLGVAYGYQYPDQGALSPREFSGGAAAAAGQLERLGFEVVTSAFINPPKPGDEYPSRTAIYEAYGGQNVQGIQTFPGDPTVNVFSDEQGPYADEVPNGVEPFEYRGDGLTGNQTMTRGNALLDRARIRREPIRYWYRPAGRPFRFLSWAIVLGRARVWGMDITGGQRLEYSWELVLIPSPDPRTWPAFVMEHLEDAVDLPDLEPPRPASKPRPDDAPSTRTYQEFLDLLGLASDSPVRSTRRASNSYARSRHAREAVLVRAGGHCENNQCTGMPPDTRRDGQAILEVDHIHDLAFGGPDHPSVMIALCPNCHAAKTHGAHRNQMVQRLKLLALQAHTRASQAIDPAGQARPARAPV